MGAKRLLAVACMLAVGFGLTACVPGAGEAPPPEAPAVRTPTLAEFVTTLRVYDEAPEGKCQPEGSCVHADAVHDLVVLVFGDLGPDFVQCFDVHVVDPESGRAWFAKNPSSPASGLSQLNGHYALAETLTGSRDLFNPWVNLVAARSIVDGQGGSLRPAWSPHSC